MKADLELRITFINLSQPEIPTYEFRAVTSFGQEFLADVLELRGTGHPTRKMYVAGKDRAARYVKLALDENLSVLSMAAGAK